MPGAVGTMLSHGGVALVPWHAREGQAWGPGPGGDAPHDHERPARSQGHGAGLAGGTLSGSAPGSSAAQTPPGLARLQAAPPAPSRPRWRRPNRGEGHPAAHGRIPGLPVLGGSGTVPQPPCGLCPNSREAKPKRTESGRHRPTRSATFRETLRRRPAGQVPCAAHAEQVCGCVGPTCADSPVHGR